MTNAVDDHGNGNVSGGHVRWKETAAGEYGSTSQQPPSATKPFVLQTTIHRTRALVKIQFGQVKLR